MLRGERVSNLQIPSFKVALPASLASDTPHLREKTGKLGLVARACSMFSVTEIYLYPDDKMRRQEMDVSFCEQILNFAESPQYLRKRLFKLSPEMKYAGILPPLQTPSHSVPHSIAESKAGDIREGVVISSRSNRIMVDVGLGTSLECSGEFAVGSRLTVRLTEVGRKLLGEVVDRSKINIYWGYRVRPTKFGLGSLLEKEKSSLKIGTSRFGANMQNVWSKVSDSIRSVNSVIVAFGSPRMGLREILRQEDKAPADVFDFYLNTVPGQATATVRTEEAVLVTLGLLNEIRGMSAHV